jgi:eukaryotic-like serine/threonine-protein kinase
MALPSLQSAPPGVGQELAGKYLVGEVLGEGGMGTVYAATHRDLDRPVAIKVLREELAAAPDLLARLMLEARAAARIHSEHVCRVLDVGRLESGAPYIVMEYLVGADLGALLETQGPLGETAAVDYLLEACEAVAEAHAAGIIHRDLKPENLFLARRPDGSAVIKVLDFGISKATGLAGAQSPSTLTSPTSALGSPHFMAPEQMSAAHDADARADIWALGAILYQLVSGALAFDGESLPAVCAAVLQANPIPVRQRAPHVTPELERAIHRCLSKNRDDRFRTVAELASAIAPLGSTRARTSLSRIARLLDGSDGLRGRSSGFWPATPPGTRKSAPPSGVEMDATVQADSEARHGSLAPISTTDARRTQRRRAAWVIGIAAPGLVAAGLGIAWARARAPKTVEPRTPIAVTRAPASETPPVTLPLVAAAASASAPVASVSTALAPRSRSAGPPAAPRASRSSSPQAVSPWNPESFGGRR